MCREDFSVSIWELLDELRLRISRILASGGAMNVHGFSMSTDRSVICTGGPSVEPEDMTESRRNAHARERQFSTLRKWNRIEDSPLASE